MPITARHAKLLANMLSDDARSILRIYDEHAPLSGVEQAALEEVIEYKLIRKTTDIISGKQIWVLTEDGKKVAACL